jgi:hypothetical protein
MDSLEQLKQRKLDIRYETWTVSSLYRTGSLTTVARERAKYNLDLMGVQEVIWGRGGIEPAGDYTFVHRNGNENHELGTGYFLNKRIITAVKRAQFVHDRMSYIILQDRWCDIIFLNVHAPTELWSRNIEIKKYKPTILPVVLYGCETWSLTLTEECKLGVFENRVLGRISGPKRSKIIGGWKNCKMRSFITLVHYQI